MAYAAILQNMIYKAGPCYDHPLKCPEAKINNPITGETTILHNQVHVAIQTPAYFLIAMSEIFASITGLEYAYTKAPTNMKAFVMSMFLLTNAFGALFGLALASTAKDPKLTWMYTGLAVSAFIAGVIFWLLYSHLNRSEDAMNLISNGDGEHNGQEEDKTGLDAMFQSRPKSYRMSELPAKTVADQIVHRSNSERQGVVIAPPPAVPTEGEMTEVTHR
jgi:POT family proton-dependent oligopeptide transporter